MRNYFRQYTFLTLLLLILASFSFAQDGKFPAPREETLLNDLKILIWSKPNTGKVEVKLRIHSGAAFDPKDKEGAMAMLAEILFPEEGILEFFQDDLEGSLEIVTTHDYVQINTTAKSSEFLAVIETLSSAVSEPQIDKETLAKVKPRHLNRLAELEKDANYIADQAVAERLYGDYPYGKAVLGTTESINKLDFADLIFAKQRFLTADNATLTISGDVNSNYAYRAARRLFGGWQKSLKKVPANFRIPETPDITPLTINVDEPNVSISRYAFDSFSRKHNDYFSAAILAKIFDERYKNMLDKELFKNATVTNLANYLRGHVILGNEMDLEVLRKRTVPLVVLSFSEKETRTAATFHKTNYLFEKIITQSEFEKAKAEVLNELNQTSPSDFWFEIHTYSLGSIKSEIEKAKSVTLTDVQNTAKRLGENKVVDISIESTEEEAPKKDDIEKVVVPDQLEEDPKDPFR